MVISQSLLLILVYLVGMKFFLNSLFILLPLFSYSQNDTLKNQGWALILSGNWDHYTFRVVNKQTRGDGTSDQTAQSGYAGVIGAQKGDKQYSVKFVKE
jgi:hypothetical protein